MYAVSTHLMRASQDSGQHLTICFEECRSPARYVGTHASTEATNLGSCSNSNTSGNQRSRSWACDGHVQQEHVLYCLPARNLASRPRSIQSPANSLLPLFHFTAALGPSLCRRWLYTERVAKLKQILSLLRGQPLLAFLDDQMNLN